MGHIDWRAVERSPEFRELVAKRRRFVAPATGFFLSWYIGFILLAGYAEGFMGHQVVDGLTVGYVLALTQFLMVWGLGWAYLRYADRVLDPLREAAAARALEVEPGPRLTATQDTHPFDPVRVGVAPAEARP